MFLPLLALVFLAVLAALYLPLKRLYLAHPVSLWRRPSALNSSVLPTTQDAHTTALHPPPPPSSLRGRGRGRARSKGRLFGLGDRLGFNFGARRAKSLGPVLPRFNPASTPYAGRGRGGHEGGRHPYVPLASAPASPTPSLASSPYVAEFASGTTNAVPLVDLSASWGTFSSISHSSAASGSGSSSKHPEMLVDVSHANEAEYELIDVSVPPSPAAWARAHPPLKPTPTSSFPTSPAAGAASFPIAFLSSTSSTAPSSSSTADIKSIEAMNGIQKTPSSSSPYAPSHTATSLSLSLEEVSEKQREKRMEMDVPVPDREGERELRLETHLPSPPLSPTLPTARPAAFFTLAREEGVAPAAEAPILLPVVPAQGEVELEAWVQEGEVQREVDDVWMREERDEDVWTREVHDEALVARDPFADVDVEEQEAEQYIESNVVPAQPPLLLPLSDADADADAAPDAFGDPFQEVADLQTPYEDEEELLVEMEEAEDLEDDHDDVTHLHPPVPALHIDLPPPRVFSASFPVEAEAEDKDELDQEETQTELELELDESELPSAHAIDVLVAGVRAMEAQVEEAAPAYDEAPAYSPGAAVSVSAPAPARLFARTPGEEESADFEHEEDSFDGVYPGTVEGGGEAELGPLPAHLTALASLPRVEPEHEEQRAQLVRWLDALPELPARTDVGDVLVAEVETQEAPGEEDVSAAAEHTVVEEEEQDGEVGEQEDPAELALPSLPLPSTPLPTEASLLDDETDPEVDDPEELTLPSLPLPVRKTLAEEYPAPPIGDTDVDELVLDAPASDEFDIHAGAEEMSEKALHVDTAHLSVPVVGVEAEDNVREQDLASAMSSSSASPSSAVVPLPTSKPVLHSRSTTDWDLEDEDSSDPEAEEDLGTSRALTMVPRMIPAWSRRAAAAPALGLPSSTLALHQRERELAALGVGEERVPGAFPGSASAFSASFQLDKSTLSAAGVLVGDEKIGGEAKSSAVEVRSGGAAKPRRSPLDAALAMQLRPGFGLGADGAWLVRFLMSFFGWFAVLVAGGQEFS